MRRVSDRRELEQQCKSRTRSGERSRATAPLSRRGLRERERLTRLRPEVGAASVAMVKKEGKEKRREERKECFGSVEVIRCATSHRTPALFSNTTLPIVADY